MSLVSFVVRWSATSLTYRRSLDLSNSELRTSSLHITTQHRMSSVASWRPRAKRPGDDVSESRRSARPASRRVSMCPLRLKMMLRKRTMRLTPPILPSTRPRTAQVQQASKVLLWSRGSLASGLPWPTTLSVRPNWYDSTAFRIPMRAMHRQTTTTTSMRIIFYPTKHFASKWSSACSNGEKRTSAAVAVRSGREGQAAVTNPHKAPGRNTPTPRARERERHRKRDDAYLQTKSTMGIYCYCYVCACV
mmetsp:Transcript_8891/g.10006  ORF Transcript_8891/g.10006 Transcript_8891/m.10006 type:complete len:248 (+) Transcript_8891:1516-2259(+)